MPKKRRKGKSTKKRASPKSKRFFPDRLIGFLLTVPLIIALPLIIGGGIYLAMRPEIGLPPELKAVPPDMLLPLCALAAAVGALHLWASIRLWQGRRWGFILCALVQLSPPAYAAYTFATNPAAFRVDGSLVWSGFILFFCLLRLIGWGPRPA